MFTSRAPQQACRQTPHLERAHLSCPLTLQQKKFHQNSVYLNNYFISIATKSPYELLLVNVSNVLFSHFSFSTFLPLNRAKLADTPCFQSLCKANWLLVENLANINIEYAV